VGLAGLFPLLALYLVSGIAVPWWAVVYFLLVWCVLLAAALWWLRRRPLLVPLLPVAGLVVWFVVVQIGDAFLHWSA
jgi:hypothetical protein